MKSYLTNVTFTILVKAGSRDEAIAKTMNEIYVNGDLHEPDIEVEAVKDE